MKKLLSFNSARKTCAVLVTVLAVLENILAALVWRIAAVRSRLADALEMEERP